MYSENLSSDGFLCLHNCERNVDNLKVVTQQLAQGLSCVFPTVMVRYSHQSHSFISAFKQPIESAFELFGRSYSRQRKVAPFLDADEPENQVLMPWQVKQRLVESKEAMLLKFNTRQAQELYFEKIKGLYELGVSTAEMAPDVYVIDSGISLNHEEFASQENRFKIIFDAFGGCGEDQFGHGTHLTSLIAGENIGFSKANKVFVLKAFDRGMAGRIENIESALEAVLAFKSDDNLALINLSATCPLSPKINELIRQLWNRNALVVCPAGNEGKEIAEGMIASHDKVLTVGSLGDDFQSEETSNYGSSVQLWTVGQNTLGAHHHNPQAYFSMGGTSAASAIVTGVLARILSADEPLTIGQVLKKYQQTLKNSQKIIGQ
ncbi:MAG: S8 family serine peptidase [Bdellovibrionales bacterium]